MPRVPVPFNGAMALAAQALPEALLELDEARDAAEALPTALVEQPPGNATAVDTSPEAIQKLLERLNGDSEGGLGSEVPTNTAELDALSAWKKEQYVYKLHHKREKICEKFKTLDDCRKERPELLAINKDLLYLTEGMKPELWLELHCAWLTLAGYVGYFVITLIIWTLMCKHQPRRREPEATKPEELAIGNFHPVGFCACLQGLPRTIFETLGSCVSGGANIWASFYTYVTFESILHLMLVVSMCRVRVNLRDSHEQGKEQKDILLDLLCVCCCWPCTNEQEAEFVELYEKHKHSEGKPGDQGDRRAALSGCILCSFLSVHRARPT